jgi:hypothetical protein
LPPAIPLLLVLLLLSLLLLSLLLVLAPFAPARLLVVEGPLTT